MMKKCHFLLKIYQLQNFILKTHTHKKIMGDFGAEVKQVFEIHKLQERKFFFSYITYSDFPPSTGVSRHTEFVLKNEKREGGNNFGFFYFLSAL